MNSPKKFRTISRLLKLFALSLYTFLPFIGFFLGIKYQKNIDQQHQQLQTAFVANWKTYANIQYNFSLMYPQALKTSPLANGEQASLAIQYPSNCRYCSGFITVAVSNVPPKENLQQIVEEKFGPAGFKITDFQKITIGGETALLSINGIPAEGYGQAGLVIHNNKLYFIGLYTFNATKQQDNDAFNILKEIITTFKFTD